MTWAVIMYCSIMAVIAIYGIEKRSWKKHDQLEPTYARRRKGEGP